MNLQELKKQSPADLIAQAEHDVNAQSILITDDKDNSVEPIFDLEGEYVKGVVDAKNQTHINNKDILKAVNSISANLDFIFL